MPALKRVMIVGQPGAGKSTLAREIGAITGLPVYYIDQIHWLPGWVERSETEKNALFADVHAKPRWVFEGGGSSTWPERLARADTLIWLDFPLRVRAWRVFKRTVKHYGQTRPDLPENCPEHFDWEFASWIWNTRHSGCESMRSLFASAPKDKSTHRLVCAMDVDRYLLELKRQYAVVGADQA